jgi:acyl-coenzyme A thioesterase PaaI-like protein
MTNGPRQWTKAELADMEAFWNAHPGMKHLGAAIDLSHPERVRVYIDSLQSYHRGGLGTRAVNGVIIAGLFDLVVGLTGFVRSGGRRTGVAQLSIQYLYPVHGDRIDVVGEATKVGRNLVFVAAYLEDRDEKICVRGEGVAALVGSDPVKDLSEFAF